MKISLVKNEYSLIRKMLGYIYWASEDPVFALLGEVNRANYDRVIYQSRIYFSVRDLLERTDFQMFVSGQIVMFD